MARSRASTVLLFALFFSGVSACSDETLDFFFDVPPPTPEETAEAERQRQQEAASRSAARGRAGGGFAFEEEAGERPAIESVETWDQAAEMLPKDDFNEPDWVAALEQKVVKPRRSLGPARGPAPMVFGFDFYLQGPDPAMDAFFPHSVHTEWLGCDSCHPKIFPVRGTEMTMDEIFAGEYCGRCHGVVAFALDNCVRCHTGME